MHVRQCSTTKYIPSPLLLLLLRLQLTKLPRLALNLWSSCVCLLDAEINRPEPKGLAGKCFSNLGVHLDHPQGFCRATWEVGLVPDGDKGSQE